MNKLTKGNTELRKTGKYFALGCNYVRRWGVGREDPFSV